MKSKYIVLITGQFPLIDEILHHILIALEVYD
jgi:hypothetical protein